MFIEMILRLDPRIIKFYPFILVDLQIEKKSSPTKR